MVPSLAVTLLFVSPPAAVGALVGRSATGMIVGLLAFLAFLAGLAYDIVSLVGKRSAPVSSWLQPERRQTRAGIEPRAV